MFVTTTSENTPSIIVESFNLTYICESSKPRAQFSLYANVTYRKKLSYNETLAISFA